MSNKPVNFYQGAKGTFRIDIIELTIGEGLTQTKATHSFEEISQAIDDGFLPYCVRKSGGEYYYFFDSYADVIDNPYLLFSGETGNIKITTRNNVTIIEKDSGDSGGSDGNVIFGGAYRATFNGIITEATPYVVLNTFPIFGVTPIPIGYVPVITVQTIRFQSLGPYYGGYNCWYGEDNTANVHFYLTQHTSDITIPETDSIQVVFGVFYVKLS